MWRYEGVVGTMMKTLKDIFAGFGRRSKFSKVDFGILKTLLMLAAIDGEFSAEEMALFKDLAKKCTGYSGKSFTTLWKDALHGAGYLVLQSRFMSKKELAAEFVREVEKDFIAEIATAPRADRERAFRRLETMASADGDYSEIERECIVALAGRVKEWREAVATEMYPRGAIRGA